VAEEQWSGASGQWSVASNQPSYDVPEFDPGDRRVVLRGEEGKILAPRGTDDHS